MADAGATMRPRRRALHAAAAVALLWATPGQAETLLDRGRYLVNGIGNCGNCHSPHNPDGTLAGPAFSGGGAIFGPGFTAYPPNLTPDRATGLGTWTEEQIVTALREGRTPQGHVLRPPMPVPFYRTMSDRDAHAIAAYLRALPPVAHATPPSQYEVPLPATYGPPLASVSGPDPSDTVAVGFYLAQMGHCMLCHTPLDARGHPDIAHRAGAGGLLLRGSFGEVVTPNITQDKTAGIGTWTDPQIRDALTRGVRPDGTLLAPVMPWRYLATMRAPDIDAIIAYLRTIKPVLGTP